MLVTDMGQLPDTLRGQGAIGIDLETCDPELKTRGPGPHRGAFIAGVSIGTEAGFNAYLPVGHEVGPNLPKAKVLSWLGKQLKISTPKVGARLVYDLGFLIQAGVPFVGPFYDVQVAEPLLDENKFVFSLESITKQYLGEGKNAAEMDAWLVERFGKKNPRNHIWRAPADVVSKYALPDSDQPLRVFRLQEKELKFQQLWDLFLMESKLTELLARMHLRGVRVDIAATEELDRDYGVEHDDLIKEVKHETGHEVNVWAARSLAKVFDHIGLEYPLTAKTKQPSFTAPWLEGIDHPIGKKIRRIRWLDKMRGTFLQGCILEGHHEGRVHTQFNQLKSDEGGAVTGRFSSKQPNLQFVPARTEESSRVRSSFLPDEGQDWGKADYCVSPETRVLTTDLRHVRADDVRPGDELVGFDEDRDLSRQGTGKGKHIRRKLRITKVLHTKRLRRPCLFVETTTGSFTCSVEHRWLATHSQSWSYKWMRTDELRIGSRIQWFCDVWDTDESREAGWIAGFMDGEGSVGAQSHLGVGQKKGPVLDRAKKWFRDNGYRWVERDIPDKNMEILLFFGGRRDSWRFLGTTRPTRLVPKIRERHIEGRSIHSRTATAGIVTNVTEVGEQEVIAIQTEHGTMIANGFCSHNSQIEYRLIVHDAACMGLRGAADVVRRYHEETDVDFHNVVAEMVFGKGFTKSHRQSAKTINFGLAYGEGVAKLAIQLGMTVPEAEVLLRTYHQRAPFIRPLAQTLMGMAGSKAEVRTLLNRKRRFNLWARRQRDGTTLVLPHRFPGSQRAFTHKALNARVQGSAADIMKKAMVDVWESGVVSELGVPQLTVHDELDVSVPRTKRGREAFREMKYIMQNTVEISVPLIVDASTGRDWGKADRPI